jgi:hypothetical protein
MFVLVVRDILNNGENENVLKIFEIRDTHNGGK